MCFPRLHDILPGIPTDPKSAYHAEDEQRTTASQQEDVCDGTTHLQARGKGRRYIQTPHSNVQEGEGPHVVDYEVHGGGVAEDHAGIGQRAHGLRAGISAAPRQAHALRVHHPLAPPLLWQCLACCKVFPGLTVLRDAAAQRSSGKEQHDAESMVTLMAVAVQSTKTGIRAHLEHTVRSHAVFPDTPYLHSFVHMITFSFYFISYY